MVSIKSNKIYYVLVLLAFAVVLGFRLVNLHADSPLGVSTGQELSTDPPQYTSFARNKALYGEWEIFSTRYTLFVNNITTYAAYPFLKILGTGRGQSNLVAVFFGMMAILFSFLVWKRKDRMLALIAMLFLGFNFVFLVYTKVTFLETSTVGTVCLAGYFLMSPEKRTASRLLAGVLFAMAAFYSKLLALVFIPVALPVLALEIYQEDDSQVFKKFNALYSFAAGYLAVVAIWIIFGFFAKKGEVSGYISEISTGMYGAPKALESVKMFFVQLYSYGFDNRLWARLPETFLIGMLGFAVVAGKMFSATKGFLRKIDRIDLFYLLWFAGTFVMLFPWNYRPIRYGILIFPALAYLAARWVVLVGISEDGWGKRLWPLYILTGLCSSLAAYHLLIAPHFDERSLELIIKYIPYGLAIGVVLTLLAFTIGKLRIKETLLSGGASVAMRYLPLVIALFILGYQFIAYKNGIARSQNTIHNASVDLGKILAPDAVVAGSYSSALTQENKLRSIIKMFGVPVVDKEFFVKTPVTHVAIEAGRSKGSNEDRAFTDYPNIFNNAPVVAVYYIRGYQVNVYLISRNSPNAEARAYQPSLFERAAIAEFENQPDSARALLTDFETKTPGVMSCQLLRMRMSLEQKDLKGAISYLKGALIIDKENAVAQRMLGDIYLQDKPQRVNEAFTAYKEALKYAPDDRYSERQLEILKPYIN